MDMELEAGFIKIKMPPRNYQVRRNLLEEMTDQQLIERYRLNKETVEFLCELLKDKISPNSFRNRSLTATEKILVTLRYLASGQFQINDSDLHQISQPTASRVIAEVISALSDPVVVTQFIKFPTGPNKIREMKEDFHGIAGFPNVVGLIDCTHIQIKRPSMNEPAYVNRMSYHSINTQIVFDNNDLIIDLVARWPGSTHDSRILRGSGLWAMMERGALGPGINHLLGDSGYPCKRWLLTPFLHPQPGAQINYNRSHKSTRSKVERGIGQLKQRWGVLHGEIRLSPIKVCKVIMSCGVLHNLCKVRNIPLPGMAPVLPNMNGGGQHMPLGIQDGLRYRDYIATTYF